jgi:hypothetical protein
LYKIYYGGTIRTKPEVTTKWHEKGGKGKKVSNRKKATEGM